jgi:dipeptidase D
MAGVAKYILAFGAAHGLETRQDGTGNLLVCKPPTPGFEHSKTVVIQSHLDMVVDKNSTVAHDFEKDPIDAFVDGEWVRARETTLGADNGLGVALTLALLADPTLRHGPLEALFTVDEEVGMVGVSGLKAGFLKGSVLLNCDSESEGELFVGCAGGTDLNITFQYKKGAPLIEGDVPVKITLAGLKGGHSGLDIHLGRANANKLMFRFLKEAIRDCGARLATIDGGSKRNAIPREAAAVITLPNDNVEALWELVADYQELWHTEYAGIEPDLRFTAELTQPPLSLVPEEIQDDLVNAIEGCQNGVISLLYDFPDTVESSSNLATVKSSKGKIDIRILVRSLSESRKDSVCSSLESIFSMAGAKVEYDGAYSGWQPNLQSPVLKTMQETWKALHGGQEPAVKVIHAGLECGIIRGVYPEMDMISFGPDIVFPHSPNEAVRIASVRKVWDFMIAALEALR